MRRLKQSPPLRVDNQFAVFLRKRSGWQALEKIETSLARAAKAHAPGGSRRWAGSPESDKVSGAGDRMDVCRAQHGGAADFRPLLRSILEHDQPWFERRLHALEESIRKRLFDLSRHLGDADWLDGAFSAADILMVTVLRWLQGSGILEDFSNIAGDVARAEGRPATGGPSTLNFVVFTAASAVG